MTLGKCKCGMRAEIQCQRCGQPLCPDCFNLETHQVTGHIACDWCAVILAEQQRCFDQMALEDVVVYNTLTRGDLYSYRENDPAVLLWEELYAMTSEHRTGTWDAILGHYYPERIRKP